MYRRIERRRGNRAKLRPRGKALYAELRRVAFWWCIGALFGILCVVTFGKEIRDALIRSLQEGVESLLYEIVQEENIPDALLMRSMAYIRLFLAVWLCSYIAIGKWGIRGLILVRGFLDGYAQGVWLLAYGLKGAMLGCLAQGLPALLWSIGVAGILWSAGWLRMLDRRLRIALQFAMTIGFSLGIAGIEVYLVPQFLRLVL